MILGRVGIRNENRGQRKGRQFRETGRAGARDGEIGRAVELPPSR